MSGSHKFDAFLSFSQEDAEWVEVLAGNLARSGLTVSLDRWELVAGELVAVELQRRLAASNSVAFVISPASVGRGWVSEEFAAAIDGSGRGRQRLIPVLWGDVALPPFVASRLYV